MRSRYGIEYDLAVSTHVSEHGGMWFYFSSAAHKRKFDNGVHKRMDWMRHSMSKRFHLPVNSDDLACLQWYMMCETRGFHVGMCVDETGTPTVHALKPSDVGVMFTPMFIGEM